MTKNVGSADKIFRIVVGLLLLAFAIPVGFPATGYNWLGWIGVVPLLTAFLGICPLYSLVGFSSCPVSRK